VWVPLGLQPQLSPAPGRPLTDRHDRWLNLIGRLKPDGAAARLEAALNAHAAQLDQAFPDTRERRTRRISVTPASTLPPGFRQAAWWFAALLLAIAGLGLLIACANVANLLLSRASARRQEMGIRQSLGASRGRLLRQMLTESVLLALLGGLGGLLVAFWSKGLIHLFSPPTPVPITFDLSLDWRVLGFAFALSLGAGLIFGAAPAWQAARTNLVASLKNEADPPGRRRIAARDLLVVAQLTLSMVLLTGAGLCVRSLHHLKRGEAGFDPTNVAMMWLDLGMLGYREAQGREFYDRLLERVRALPGVTSASLVNNAPLGLAFSEIPISLPDREPPPAGALITVGHYVVTPDYFDTLKLPLLRGRHFTSRDAPQAPKVILVNEAMARRCWPNADPLGKRIQLTPRPGPQYESFEVVGVVRDHKHVSLLEDPRPCFYRPFAQSWQPQMSLLARASNDSQPLLAALRREAQALEESVPILALRSLRENMVYSLLPWRMVATLAGLAGGLALLLAALGVYGVVSFAVSRRLPEFGLRLALGAQPGDIFMLVLKQAAKLALVSLGFGLVIALVVARALGGFLYGVSPVDPLTFVSVPLLLLGVALAACWLPARRATKLDPMTVLRSE
jgi:predicted permease